MQTEQTNFHRPYKRVLLKLSGESLQGGSGFGISPAVLTRFGTELKELLETGLELGIVVGGGNLFRGEQLSAAGLGRVSADYMGMMATVMNCLAIQDSLSRLGIPVKMMSALPIKGVIEAFDRQKALKYLYKKRVVLFAAGTGHPFFTTDSAASLRAIEIEADVLLKATQVDAIYSADPKKYPDAKSYKSLSYTQVLEKNLGIMDMAAICLCRDHAMPIRIFNVNQPGLLKAILRGETDAGTLVSA